MKYFILPVTRAHQAEETQEYPTFEEQETYVSGTQKEIIKASVEQRKLGSNLQCV